MEAFARLKPMKDFFKEHNFLGHMSKFISTQGANQLGEMSKNGENLPIGRFLLNGRQKLGEFSQSGEKNTRLWFTHFTIDFRIFLTSDSNSTQNFTLGLPMFQENSPLLNMSNIHFNDFPIGMHVLETSIGIHV